MPSNKFARIIIWLLLAVCAAGAQQSEKQLPSVGEGTLLCRDASGSYEAIPLKHTDVALDVRGLVLSATVAQQYVNEDNTPVEAIYVFPLPHDAAVYDMEIRVGDRVIHSVVKERAEAKRTYEQARAEGHRAALLEQERPNIFTTSIANIMPGDKIEVRLRYVQTLKWEEGKVRLEFPMVVGPRYIPGTLPAGHHGTGWAYDTEAVNDASRITPPVRDPQGRPGHDLSLSVELDPGFDTASVRSVSHTIDVQHLAGGRQRVQLDTGAVIPNKDFVLEIAQAQGRQPRAALFVSPTGDSSGEMNFLLEAVPPTLAPKAHTPVEMLYLIDVSGSMAGTSINQAREALLDALDRLQTSDRFAIIAFNHQFIEFSSDPMTATPENLDAARTWVNRLEADGGTEMLPALEQMMHKPVTPGYVRHIVLLTDGDLGNEEQIFTAMHSDLGDARLYTVAIGSAPNLFLATKMAQFGRGTFTHIANIHEVNEQMGHLLATIENPVLTDVKLAFEGVEVADQYPARPPDLFMGRPLLISGRIVRGTRGTVHITARSGDQPFEMTIPFDGAKAGFHAGIPTLWARQRVEDLMDNWRHADEQARPQVRASVIDLAMRYHLVTQFTSLVAVEDVVVNAGGQANTTRVPTELPSGWQIDKVFGTAPATGTADDFLAALAVALLLLGAALWWVSRRKSAEVAA